MQISRTVRSRFVPLFSSAGCWATGLLLGGLWLVRPDDSGWQAMPLAAILALTAAVAITWQQLRARARKQWQAALDAYAEREISRERRKTARRRVRTLSRAVAISSILREPSKPRIRRAPKPLETSLLQAERPWTAVVPAGRRKP